MVKYVMQLQESKYKLKRIIKKNMLQTTQTGHHGNEQLTGLKKIFNHNYDSCRMIKL